MSNDKPVQIVPETDPSTPEDTVVTARFNRKKIAKTVATATAAVGAFLAFGAVMKAAGVNDTLDKLADAGVSVDETDEPTES